MDTHYETVRPIGAGTYGQVDLVRSRRSQRLYAVKRMRVGQRTRRRQAINEVALLRRLKHPFIVRYRNAIVHDEVLHIIMEYADGGDLRSAIAAQRGQPFAENQVRAGCAGHGCRTGHERRGL